MPRTDGEILVVTSNRVRLVEGELRAVARAANLSLGPARYLATSGIEFDCARVVSAHKEQVRTRLAQFEVDGNFVPNTAREKQLLICDMDSTVITVECIDEVAARAGVGEQVAAITAQTMRGELNFADSLQERLELCAGVPEHELEYVWRERVQLQPGAQTLARTMGSRGAITALVSGGYTYFADRVAAAAGFSHVRANQLELVDGRLTGRAVPPILDAADKLTALRTYCATAKLDPGQAVAVGDGANDAPMIVAAGLGVGWHPKSVLHDQADAVLNFSGLDAVLCLQGIPESAWVRE